MEGPASDYGGKAAIESPKLASPGEAPAQARHTMLQALHKFHKPSFCSRWRWGLQPLSRHRPFLTLSWWVRPCPPLAELYGHHSQGRVLSSRACSDVQRSPKRRDAQLRSCGQESRGPVSLSFGDWPSPCRSLLIRGHTSNETPERWHVQPAKPTTSSHPLLVQRCACVNQNNMG